ncbi:MAG: ABC transporter ATP-binding protein, partial [Alphaproteobacteria bacterium]
LDEPTNDFDIVTLNVLEEYLSEFNGCLVIVSHDRFFMDKLVNHLFIFEGNGEVYDFPGNYSEYRSSQKSQEIEARRNEVPNAVKNIAIEKKEVAALKKKLSYKEKNELQLLTTEIELLEKEKSELETALSSGTLPPGKLVVGSHRIAEIIILLENKTNRWIELSE